jgi:hypothetical protein
MFTFCSDESRSKNFTPRFIGKRVRIASREKRVKVPLPDSLKGN